MLFIAGIKVCGMKQNLTMMSHAVCLWVCVFTAWTRTAATAAQQAIAQDTYQEQATKTWRRKK